MGYAILRAEPRTISGTAAMLRHALREDVPANAVPDSPPPELLDGVTSSAKGMERVRTAIDAAKAGKRWQKSVKPVLDILVTFSHEDEKRLSEEDQDRYFRLALDFVRERFGGTDNLLSAAIHRDESTAHVQILMLAREKNGVKLGASQFLKGRGNLHQLQNDFWKECGKPFGLRRGEPRTGARNLPVRQLYAALAAGAEIPELVPVPEVSIKDKVLAPEKITQRQKAIDQNNATVEELRALATRGKGIHPKLLEQQAERYRVASQRAEDAEKQAQEASKRAVSAISKAEAMEDALAELGRRYTAKMAQFEALDRDIDRLREMRDREARLGNNQPG